MLQTMTADGSSLIVHLRNGQDEVHTFDSPAEVKARMDFVQQALSWVGTPFVNCGANKGPAPDGGVDCAMLLVRSAVDSGLLPEFDPRPYPPRWHMHQSEEKFIWWLEDQLNAVEVTQPRVGDIVVYKFGRCFSHGAIMINSDEIVHAWFAASYCLSSRMSESLLTDMPMLGPRPIKYFDLMKRSLPDG